MGIAYAYELPAGEKTILNFEAKIGGGIWHSSAYGTDWQVIPYARFEPRYHYNFFKRQEKGKSVANNSSSYLALSTTIQIPFSLGTTNYPDPGLSLVPKWGFRAPIVDNFSFELAGGYGIMKIGSSELQGTLEADIMFSFYF